MSKLDRDRDMIVQTLIDAARSYRSVNLLDWTDEVRVKIPPGVRGLIAQRDLDQLKFMNITVEEK